MHQLPHGLLARHITGASSRQSSACACLRPSKTPCPGFDSVGRLRAIPIAMGSVARFAHPGRPRTRAEIQFSCARAMGPATVIDFDSELAPMAKDAHGRRCACACAWQVPLNSQGECRGGRLVYATRHVLPPGQPPAPCSPAPLPPCPRPPASCPSSRRPRWTMYRPARILQVIPPTLTTARRAPLARAQEWLRATGAHGRRGPSGTPRFAPILPSLPVIT